MEVVTVRALQSMLGQRAKNQDTGIITATVTTRVIVKTFHTAHKTWKMKDMFT